MQGAPSAVVRDVRKATRETVGRSLLAVDARAIEDALRALPSVAGASVDRAFPHTLVIKVAPERPVAVIRREATRRGSRRDRPADREIDVGSNRGFPRLWLKREIAIDVGKRLPASLAEATRALAAAREVRIPHRVQAVRAAEGQLTLVLRRGPEIRLGAPRQVASEARRCCARVPAACGRDGLRRRQCPGAAGREHIRQLSTLKVEVEGVAIDTSDEESYPRRRNVPASRTFNERFTSRMVEI